MKFFVTSEWGIETLSSPVPYALISIKSRDRDDRAKLPSDPHRKAVLFIAFGDCSHRERIVDKPILKKEARLIWQFFNEHKESVELFIIQCEAGISRSAGVCAALMEGSGFKSDYAYRYPFLPNEYVKAVMLRVRP